jgi:hypothetical protein
MAFDSPDAVTQNCPLPGSTHGAANVFSVSPLPEIVSPIGHEGPADPSTFPVSVGGLELLEHAGAAAHAAQTIQATNASDEFLLGL